MLPGARARARARRRRRTGWTRARSSACSPARGPEDSPRRCPELLALPSWPAATLYLLARDFRLFWTLSLDCCAFVAILAPTWPCSPCRREASAPAFPGLFGILRPPCHSRFLFRPPSRNFLLSHRRPASTVLFPSSLSPSLCPLNFSLLGPGPLSALSAVLPSCASTLTTHRLSFSPFRGSDSISLHSYCFPDTRHLPGEPQASHRKLGL